VALPIGSSTDTSSPAPKITPDQKAQIIADAKSKGISPAIALANASVNGVQAALSSPSTFNPPTFPSVLPSLPSLDTSKIPNPLSDGILGSAGAALSSATSAATSLLGSAGAALSSATSAAASLTGVSNLSSSLAATAGQAVNGVSSQLLASATAIASPATALLGGQTASVVANKLGVVGVSLTGV
jgi:hypothetical protein